MKKLILGAFLMTWAVLAGAQNEIEFQFVNPQDPLPCEMDVEVCWDMQIRSLTGDARFLSELNIRVFFDEEEMSFVSSTENVDEFAGLSSTTPSVSDPADVDLGFTTPKYLQHDIAGLAFPGIGFPLGSTYETVATMCFTTNIDITTMSQFCASLVYDKDRDDLTVGIDGQNEGINLISQAGTGQPLEQEAENVNQYNWNYTSNNTGVESFTNCVPTACVLPVTLVDFKATADGKISRLSWTTVTEVNNSHFEVQRSADGVSFETIGEVKGVGNSAVNNHYSFNDIATLNDDNFYRLRQVDMDGTFDYSQIVKLHYASLEQFNQNTLSMSYFPNPVETVLTATMESGSIDGEGSYFNVIDAKGNHVKWIAFAPVQTLNVEDLSEGVYTVQVVTSKGEVVHQERIVKVGK